MLIQNFSKLPKIKSIPNIIAVDIESENTQGGLEGYSFAYKVGKKIIGHYIPINHYFDEFPDGSKYKNMDWDKSIIYLKNLVAGRRVVMHNAQFDLTILEVEAGVNIPLNKVEDTMLIHWCLDTERKHGLKPIMNGEYGFDLPDFDASKESFEKFSKYGEDDSKYTLWLFYKIYPEIKKRKKLFNSYRKWEINTIPVLQDINYKKNFIRIDKPLLAKYVKMMSSEMVNVGDLIVDKLGDINYNSTKQLAQVLIEAGYTLERRKPTPKMIATAYALGEEPVGNYKLDEKALVDLYKRQKGLILSAILYNRKITKLFTTYVRPISESLETIPLEKDNVKKFGIKEVYVLSGYDLMHTGTRTGRFSGHNPNLQNQPRDPFVLKMMFLRLLIQNSLLKESDFYWTDEKLRKWYNKQLAKDKDDVYLKPALAKKILALKEKCTIDIRKIFIPMPGRVFIGGDYSQLELRMIAHLSRDEVMCDKFMRGVDIHQGTADDISAIVNYILSRQDAKPLNFGLIYGLFWTTLAATTGMSKKKAKEVWEAYFELYWGIAEFIKGVHKAAKKSHYVQTIFGRRRNMDTVGINNYDSKAYMIRKNAENAAVSTIVSGSSADLIKIPMVRIHQQIKDVDIKLQVHDELLIEVDEKLVKQRMIDVKKQMEDAMKLSVPLVCDIKSGMSWRAVH